jgi:hypothetical protein
VLNEWKSNDKKHTHENVRYLATFIMITFTKTPQKEFDATALTATNNNGARKKKKIK